MPNAWFAPMEDRPLFVSAGLRTPWRGNAWTMWKSVNHEVYGFLPPLERATGAALILEVCRTGWRQLSPVVPKLALQGLPWIREAR